ncbi:MAG: hypothetical protein COA32_03785 [Fluviicola sp.]|nr:MAG: hypothetical protein COA32_03785 [Fluviicola sp.]
MKHIYPTLFSFLLLFSTLATAQEETLQQKIEEWVPLIQGGEIQTTEGLLTFCHNKKCGTIDSTGTIIVPFKYDFIRGFYNGLAAVNIGGKLTANDYRGIKNGKWGIIDKNGREITALKYDYIPAIDHGWFGNLIPVELDGKQGLINRKGKEITAISYDGVKHFDENIWMVSVKDSLLNNPDNLPNVPKYYNFKKYGLVDKSGRITPVKYSSIYIPFTDGFTKVASVPYYDKELYSSVSKKGIIDANGKEIIPLIYDNIEGTINENGMQEYFPDGLALVSVLDGERGYKHGYINKKGKIVIPVRYIKADSFLKGTAIVAVRGDSISLGVYDGVEEFQYVPHYGVINTSGKVKIPLKYNSMSYFYRGVAKVNLNGKIGFIDSTGKEIIPIKYDYIQENGFKTGNRLVYVKLNNKWGFIDNIGNEVIPVKYDEVGYFSDGLVNVKHNNKWQFLDENGKEITPLKYDHVNEFNEGFAVVTLGEKYGYIDKTGKVAIPLKFDYAYDFSNGKAMVKLYENKDDIYGKTFYIDKTGKRIK